MSVKEGWPPKRHFVLSIDISDFPSVTFSKALHYHYPHPVILKDPAKKFCRKKQEMVRKGKSPVKSKNPVT